MKFILTILLCGMLTVGFAQECKTYVPFKEGAEWVLASYNKKGKLDSKAKQKIIEVDELGSGLKAKVSQDLEDKKGEPISSSEYEMECENGNFKVSLQSIMTGSTLESFEGMEVDIDADEIVLPDDLKVGQELNDGTMKVSAKAGESGVSLMNMTVTISNRKVVDEESITTDAGTFDCYVITYDVETKFMFTIKASAKEWYSKGVGMVRSENYNKKGKLTGYTELESFTMP